MISIEILFIWIWFNSISTIYYIIRNPLKGKKDRFTAGVLAYMLSGTFWFWWIIAKIFSTFGLWSKNKQRRVLK